MINNLNENTALKFKSLSPEEKAQKGILGRLYGKVADFTNGTRNGRKYSLELWDKLLQSDLIKERFANGGIFGQLCHPDYSEINMEKIAIVMPEPPVKDGEGQLQAYVDILDTPCGRIAYQLAKYGYKFGISSRGEGDLIDGIDGEEVDPNSFTLYAFDLVEIPAVQAARLQFVESLNTQTKYGKTLKQKLNEELDKASDHDRQLMEEALKDLSIDEFSEIPYDNTKTLKDKNTYEKFKNAHVNAVPNFDYEVWGRFFDEEGKLIPELEDEYFEKLKNSFSKKTDESINESKLDESINSDFKANLRKLVSKYFKDINYDSNYSSDNEEVERAMKELYSILFNIDYNYGQNGAYNPDTDEEEYDESISESCGDKKEEKNEAVENNEAIIEELQKTLESKSILESKVAKLQEKLSVCYAKEQKLNEENAKQRKSIQRLIEESKKVNALNEKLSKAEKDWKIINTQMQSVLNKNQQLEENLKSDSAESNKLTENVNQLKMKNQKITEAYQSLKQEYAKEKESLLEDLENVKKDNKIKESDYRHKLEKMNTLVEKYKKVANNSVNRYIDSQALKLGISSNEIKNRLPESYTFDDIDSICEDLQDYKLNMSKLPFNMNLNENVRIRTNSTRDSLVSSNVDSDYMDESLYKLAGLKY